jgi:dihydrofolate reductase
MGIVISGFSMSLDGFVAGPHDDVRQVFKWYFTSGETKYTMPSGDWTFQVSSASAQALAEANHQAGVLVTGRRTFDVAHAWNGKHPMNVPVVVVTHKIPQEWAKEGMPFTFITDGVASAIEQAQVIAGDKNVVVGAPSVLRQCLALGLLDVIHVDLVPVLLGEGVRLFDGLDVKPAELEVMRVVAEAGVTHLDYRVVK